MIRKLTIALVSGIVCLLLGVTPVLAQHQYNSMKEYEKATGKKIEKFNEAPMLRMRVAAGELPPVEERLPEDPVVVTPVKEIGQYGGTVQVFNIQVYNCGEVIQLSRVEPLFWIAPDTKTIVPNLADKWEFSEDGKTLTIHLHKGIKWSDGVPFTTDDIMFWYKDVLLNKELTPAIPSILRPGGEVIKVEKVDDYTFRMHFAIPYPFMEILIVNANTMGWMLPIPAHYLKKFHIKYNPKADELAKENGFDYWYQYFGDRNSNWCGVPRTPGRPTLQAFRPIEKTTESLVFERNPYYWKVDPEGNQLPYFDRIVTTKVANTEMYNAKIVSGQADYGAFFASLDNYPLYKESAEKGGYHVYLWPSNYSGINYEPNQTCRDPILRKIFQDVRFRRALSLAIDRDDINESIYFGLGTPRQMTVTPETSYFEPRFAQAYIEYDPDRANQLLDEMGLEWDEKHEYRLRPDGKILSWTVEFYPFAEVPGAIPMAELIKGYWKKIGIKINLKQETGELLSQRAAANFVDMQFWEGDKVTEIGFTGFPEFFVPYIVDWSATWAVEWARWYQSEGKEGEEPPEKIKRLLEWYEKMIAARSHQERVEYGKKILASQAENLWTIGTVGLVPQPIIARKNMKNIPEKGIYGWDTLYTAPFHPEQFFYEQK